MRYAAFISYSSVDRTTGEQLQRALEAYIVPRPLRGQDYGRGAIAKRITPIFRDRWDADASVDLGATLRSALQGSEALIVLCSPAAARSIWVAEEIRFFRRAGRADRIFPVLIEGLPSRFDADANPQGAFPPALFERLSPQDDDGLAVPEPLAPDLRPQGDGLRFTVLKLAAALTGVPLTTLTQRQVEAERRERNTARWVAGVMTTLAVFAMIGAYTSWRANVAARTRLENAVEMAARRVDDAAGFQGRYGVPSSVIQELLDGAQKDFTELTGTAPATPTLSLQRARLDRLFAQLYESAGDTAQHRAMAERAIDALTLVPTRRRIEAPGTWLSRLPSDRSVVIERLLALDALGQAQSATGEVEGARLDYQKMAQQADALAVSHDDATSRSLRANARSALSRLAYEAGDLPAALRQTRDAAQILEGVAHDDESILELTTVQSDEAELLLELGEHAAALALQRIVVDALQKIEPTPEARRTLAAALARRGDMRVAAQRDQAGAGADFIAARALLVTLLAEDPARTDIKRDLSLAYEREGDALLQAGNVTAASEAFATCLSMRRELVARDNSNQEWRRDLSVALERLGDVRSLRGMHSAAGEAFQEALTLRQASLAADSTDVVASRDLAILWMRLGQARTNAQAPLSQIDAAYAQAIALLTPLVEGASAESRWRRDLYVAYAERGEARRLAGDKRRSRADLLAAFDLLTALRSVAPEDEQLREDDAWLQARMK